MRGVNASNEIFAKKGYAAHRQMEESSCSHITASWASEETFCADVRHLTGFNSLLGLSTLGLAAGRQRKRPRKV